MTDLKQRVGARLRQAREDKGLTQQDVANMLGISDVGYGAYERGDRLIPLDCLLKLPAILGRSINYLVDSPAAPNGELTPDEEELLALYRAAIDPGMKAVLIGMLRAAPRGYE